MSKRINSAQHARNIAVNGKASSPTADAQGVVPAIIGTDPNAFVQAAAKAAAGKHHRDDPKAHTHDGAQADDSADKAQSQTADDTANATAPVESTASGAAHMVMTALDMSDMSDDQGGSGGSGSGTPSVSHHHDNTLPIALGVGALAIGGGVAAAVSGGGTPSPTPVNHAPTFAATTQSVSAAENQTTALTAAASDVDSGDTLTYSLTGTDAALFAVSSAGVVTFKAAPDFEAPTDSDKNNTYLFNVVATDKAGAIATQAETVTVTNVNEAPTLSATQAVSVAENQTTVLTAKATDVDAGDTLAYTLTGTDAALFAVSSAGVVTFKAAPDFENPTDAGKDNIYNFNVVATDKGLLTATQAETVTVTNVNDAPVITSNLGGDTATVNVFENSKLVTAVIATDQDTGATQTYSISGGADSALFSIDSKTGSLNFIAAPNFENPLDVGKDNVYNVNVTVTDNGNPGLTDTQAIAVTVVNANEAPVIDSGATGSVNEGAPTSTIVYTAHATDPDAGTTLAYTLSGTDAAAFTINSSTGAVTLNNSADFEAKSSYSINVIATDNGISGAPVPTLSATQAVTINVVNQIDVLNLPTSGTVNAGVQVVGQPDTNFKLVADGDVQSSVIINNFTANDIIQIIHGSNVQADVGFSRDSTDLHDLRIEYADTTNNTTTTIILNDVLDNVTPVFDETTAAAAMGQVGRDFFSFG